MKAHEMNQIIGRIRGQDWTIDLDILGDCSLMKRVVQCQKVAQLMPSFITNQQLNINNQVNQQGEPEVFRDCKD